MSRLEEYTMMKDQLGNGQVQMYRECRKLAKREELETAFKDVYRNIEMGMSTFDVFEIDEQPFQWSTSFRTYLGEGVIAFQIDGVRIFDLYADLRTINIYHARVCRDLLTDLIEKEN